MSATSSPSIISSVSAPITVMCVTGNTGGHAVNNLLARNDDTIFIRGIVRSQEKGQAWMAKLSEKFGAERINKHVRFVVAEEDTDQLTTAFTGSSAVYAMLASQMSDPEYEEPKKRVSIIAKALKAANITRVVAVSSGGAHLSMDQVKSGAVYPLRLFEQAIIRELNSSTTVNNITFVRPGLFFENSLYGDYPQAKFEGSFGTFYSQPDMKLPYLSAKDIGTQIAKYLIDRTECSSSSSSNSKNSNSNSKPLYVELEGPERYSMNDFATVYSKVFKRDVIPFFIPEEQWSTILESLGFPHGRTHDLENMYAGFNAGKIVYENKSENGCISVKGTVTLEEGLTELIKEWEAQQQQTTEQTQQAQ